MDWQGKINFHKPITINGKHHGIEHESTLPVWVSGDNGRVLHTEDTGALWFGTSIEWVELTPGGIGIHNHDDLYYTEIEIDGFFEGENGGKKTIDFTNVQNKPVTFPPDVHDHDDRYYTESEVDGLISAVDVDAATYEKLVAAGDVGTSAGQLAIGDHIHTATTVTYNNTLSGLTATDVKSAIDEVAQEYNVGIDQVLYVAKNGDDADDGSMANPFLTVQAAIDSVTNASSTLYYTIFIMPGTYLENLTLKEYVGLVGFSKEGTRIRDAVAGTHSLITTGGRIFFKNIGLGGAAQNLIFTHAPGSSGGVSIWMDNCQSGTMIAHFLGGGIDYVQLRNDSAFSGLVTIHSAAFTAYNSIFMGGLTIDSAGFEDGNQDSYGSISSNTVKDCMGGTLLLQNGIAANTYGGGKANDVWVKFYNNYSWSTLTSDGNTNVSIDAQSAPDSPAAMISLNGGAFSRTDNAFAMGFDATSSTLTGDTVQAAIEEVQVNVEAINAEAATFEALDTAGDVGTLVDQVARGDHDHGTIYYTKLEFSAGQLDNRYYTETEINNTLSSYSLDSHVHDALNTTYDNTLSGLTATDVENAIDEVHVNRNILPLTAGAPITTPSTGTMEFDESTNVLYVYNGTAWVSTTLA